jgi:hypothetical protein
VFKFCACFIFEELLTCCYDFSGIVVLVNKGYFITHCFISFIADLAGQALARFWQLGRVKLSLRPNEYSEPTSNYQR